MTRTTSVLGAIALLGLVAGPSFASGVTVASDNTDQEVIKGYEGVTTSGAQMANTVVTVTRVGGAVETYTWAALTPPAGGVSGNGFSLGVAGNDTFFDPFTLTNTGTGITDIKLDGFGGSALTGHTIFDRTSGTNSTAGSPGIDFNVTSGLGNYTIVTTYSGEVSDLDNPSTPSPFGDVYRYMDISFGTVTPFVGPTLQFNADTDTVALVGLNAVPEPAPLAIMGVGVLMMGGLILRKRNTLKA